MDLSNPTRSVAPTLDMPALACLSRQDRPWTTREVADATGSTTTGARLTLERLVRNGLVIRSQIGRVRGYQFNAEHVMAGPIRELVNAQAILRRRITDQVAAWPISAELLVLFGSTARDEADADSDVDLLLLHAELDRAEQDAWQEQIDDLKRSIHIWSGNDSDVLSFTIAEWSEHRRRTDPITRTVTEACIVLAGQRSLLTATVSEVDATMRL